METLSFSLTHGFILGTTYALSALGVSLVAGLMKMVNFAHGEFYVLGAYFSYLFSIQLGLPIGLAMLISVILVFGIGMIVEELFIRPLKDHEGVALVSTFVFSIVLQNIFLLTFGPYPKKSANWAEGSVHWVGGTEFGIQRLLSGIFALASFGLFYLFITKTRFGKKIRAVAQDPLMASTLGISPIVVNRISFGLACAIAALAGVILNPVFPVTPTNGASVTVTAFVVVVIGGLGSIRGCLWGGILLGLIESLGSTYLSSQYQPLYGFTILIAVLWLKPTGLYGNQI